MSATLWSADSLVLVVRDGIDATSRSERRLLGSGLGPGLKRSFKPMPSGFQATGALLPDVALRRKHRSGPGAGPHRLGADHEHHHPHQPSARPCLRGVRDGRCGAAGRLGLRHRQKPSKRRRRASSKQCRLLMPTCHRTWRSAWWTRPRPGAPPSAAGSWFSPMLTSRLCCAHHRPAHPAARRQRLTNEDDRRRGPAGPLRHGVRRHSAASWPTTRSGSTMSPLQSQAAQ